VRDEIVYYDVVNDNQRKERQRAIWIVTFTITYPSIELYMKSRTVMHFMYRSKHSPIVKMLDAPLRTSRVVVFK